VPWHVVTEVDLLKVAGRYGGCVEERIEGVHLLDKAVLADEHVEGHLALRSLQTGAKRPRVAWLVVRSAMSAQAEPRQEPTTRQSLSWLSTNVLR